MKIRVALFFLIVVLRKIPWMKIFFSELCFERSTAQNVGKRSHPNKLNQQHRSSIRHKFLQNTAFIFVSVFLKY